MLAVMLRGNWDAEVFRRCVRDADGQIIERLEFRRGEALLLTRQQQVDACRGDLGHALLVAQTAQGEDGKPVAINKPLNPQPELPPAKPRRDQPASNADIRAENKQLKSQLGALSKLNAKLQEDNGLAKAATAGAEAKLDEAQLAEAELLDRVEKLEKELAAATKPADPPAGGGDAK